MTLVERIADHVPDFPTTGTFPLEAWHKVGREPYEQSATGDNAACQHLSTREKIVTSLKAAQKEVAARVATNCDPSAPLLAGEEWDPVEIVCKNALITDAVAEKGLADNEAPARTRQRTLLTNGGLWESPDNPLGPGLTDPEREPDLFPPDDTSLLKAHTSLTVWDKSRGEA